MQFRKSKTNSQIPSPRQRRIPPPSSERETPAMFSYHARRSEVPTTNRRENLQITEPASTSPLRSSQSNIRHTITQVGVLLLVSAFIVYESLLLQPPKVVLNASGASSQYVYNLQPYSSQAAIAASGSLFNRSKLTFNTSAVNHSLQQHFPELASVKTTIPLLGGAAVVHIIPGAPTLLETTTSGQTFVIDERGVAVATADHVKSNGSLPVVTDQSGLPVQAGHSALPSSTVAFIRIVVAELASQKIHISAIDLPARSSELDIHIAGQAYAGKFNLQADPKQQAGTFVAVANHLAEQRITPAQYVDVRLAGRAYYL